MIFSMMIVQGLQRKEVPGALSGQKSTRLHTQGTSGSWHVQGF